MSVVLPISLLALGLGQKIPPASAGELVNQYSVCVRAQPSKGRNKGLVLEVLWGSQLHKGDSFETIERHNPPGTPEGPGFGVYADSILFMKRIRDRDGIWRWQADSHRITLMHGQTECYDALAQSDGKEISVILVDGGVQFRERVPRKHRERLTFAEAKAELMRIRSKSIDSQKKGV